MSIAEILDIVGYVFMAVGIACMLFGAFSIFKLKDFYPRIMAAAKIDTVGLTTLLLGVMLRHGFSFFSGKVLLLMIVILILNPLVSHIVARSANLSGYQLKHTFNKDGKAVKGDGEPDNIIHASQE